MLLVLASLFEFSFFALFFWAFLILMVVGTAFDRNGREDIKWYLIGIGFIIFGGYYWDAFTFIGPAHIDAAAAITDAKGAVQTAAHPAQDRVVLWHIVSGWHFWAPLLSYLGFGLVYSGFEFGMTIRKAERAFATAWEAFKGNSKTVAKVDAEGKAILNLVEGKMVPVIDRIEHSAILATAKAEGEAHPQFAHAVSIVKDFVNTPVRALDSFFKTNKIIGAVITADKIGVEPKVNKVELAEHIGAWTFLWPAYGLSFVFGDLLHEFFITVANLVASISGRAVKYAFRNTFKV